MAYPVDEPPAGMAFPLPQDEPMAPMAVPRVPSGGTPADYFAGMQQGLTGTALAERAGVAVPQGMSPPDIYPRPVAPPGPSKWIGGVQPTGEEDLLGRLTESLASMPVDQARQAAAMATYFQGVRGYQKWIDEGKDPEEGFKKYGPMMLAGGGAGGRGSGIAGLAALNRMNKPQSTWEFVEGQGAEPDAYKDLTGGKQPKIVPYKPKYMVENGQTGQTVDTTGMEVFEIYPGVTAISRPGSKTFSVVKDTQGPMTPKEASAVVKAETEIAKNLDALDPKSPLYTNTVALIEGLRKSVNLPGMGGTGVFTPSRKVIGAPTAPTAPAPASTNTGGVAPLPPRRTPVKGKDGKWYFPK